MKIALVFLAGVAVALVGVWLFVPGPGTRLVIHTNEIVQHVTQPPVVLTEHVTNEIVRTNEVVIFIAGELNAYRTNSGWIAQSNQRIYAGLYKRAWSAPYSLPAQRKNSVAVLFGGGIGARYTRREILDRFGATVEILSVDGQAVFLFGPTFDF